MAAAGLATKEATVAEALRLLIAARGQHDPAKPNYTLEQLLGRITPGALPDEVFDDGPKGGEAL